MLGYIDFHYFGSCRVSFYYKISMCTVYSYESNIYILHIIFRFVDDQIRMPVILMGMGFHHIILVNDRLQLKVLLVVP